MKKADKVAAIQAEEPGFSIEEFRRIQKENEKLKKVNQILKSAAAFFSQDHLK
jgi:transposase-like protein